MSTPIDFPKPKFIPVNGVELEVFEAADAGTPIVLCHGWPEHAFSWRHQVPALVASGYHVIVPNQRGYGNSSRPADLTDYDIDNSRAISWPYSITTDTAMPFSPVMTGGQWSSGGWPCCIHPVSTS